MSQDYKGVRLVELPFVKWWVSLGDPLNCIGYSTLYFFHYIFTKATYSNEQIIFFRIPLSSKVPRGRSWHTCTSLSPSLICLYGGFCNATKSLGLLPSVVVWTLCRQVIIILQSFVWYLLTKSFLNECFRIAGRSRRNVYALLLYTLVLFARSNLQLQNDVLPVFKR